MTFAELLLLASALLALASAVITLIFRPNRMVTLVASASLLLLGLQQLGWSRAINSIPLGERNYWLDLSFVCWLPVSGSRISTWMPPRSPARPSDNGTSRGESSDVFIMVISVSCS